MENKKPAILKWALILSIIIILNLFYNVALDLVLDRPQIDDFCQTEQVNKVLDSEKECVDEGGSWTAYPEEKINPTDQPTTPVVRGYCDKQYECRNQYQDTREDYEKKVFMSLIVLGVITFAASLFIKSNPVISNALALAAVLDFVIASIRYWESAGELLKVLILAVALIILFYLAYKKFKE